MDDRNLPRVDGLLPNEPHRGGLGRLGTTPIVVPDVEDNRIHGIHPRRAGGQHELTPGVVDDADPRRARFIFGR